MKKRGIFGLILDFILVFATGGLCRANDREFIFG